MLLIRGTKIIVDGERVGSIIFTREVYTRKRLDLLYSDVKLPQFSLPIRFKYVWVEALTIYPKYRRLGYGSDALQLLEESNTLIALGIGAVSGSRLDSEARLTFYRKLKYKMVQFNTIYTYAFKYVPLKL